MNFKSILQALGLLAVLFTLFPFVAADYWWIRMFDFPHVQLTTFTLIAILVYFFRFDIRSWRDYAYIGILTVCFLFQLSKIYPYTPLSEVEVENNEQIDPNATISLLVANVLQKNTAYHELLDEVLTRNPDVILLTETNAQWQRHLKQPMKQFGYPYKVEMPLENTYGMICYSKLELINPRVKFLLEDSIPSIHTRLRMRSGALIELHAIHPTPPLPPHDASSTDRDAQMMIVAKTVRKSSLPVIVAGDFNDVAWSESTSLFQNVSGLLDPRIGRGFYNTYSADNWLMRWPLDHLFVSEEFRVMDLSLGNDICSDHFPLYTKLSLEPVAASQQKKDPASTEELEDAQKQIEKEARKDRKEKEKKKD